ncbi:MAG TPA: M20/M25/M40 family metallo-hydrolase, partial [Nitrospirota bacterium]
SGASGWYPDFGLPLMTFDLEVKLPPTWDCVSQGSRALHENKDGAVLVKWNSPEPQDSIFLIAARFTEYAKPAGSAQAMVFLRTPDEGLANKYLDATIAYLELYSRLIVPYPYKKFALVENFWETGFGMPSFTLLGPSVIRLPFIINASYPHEILHNWWGNSVYPDYEKGNWSEGLTAYLADHLMKEQQGAGAEYRLNTLQKYSDYVLGSRDFPLTQFRSRHSSSSEAIGYGKSLMFFHMLRQELGDDTFRRGIREFYTRNKYRFATFDDLRSSFEAVSKKDLASEFEQWVTKVGAPQLRVTNPAVIPKGKGFTLSAILEQTQPGDAYHLRVPIGVTLEGHEQAFQTVIEMSNKKQSLNIPLPARPIRLDIDPEFDIFRRLDRNETPPAISQALGAKQMLVLIPASASAEMLEAYRTFAGSLAQSGPDKTEIKLDREMKTLPKDRAVVILGWENLFAGTAMTAFEQYDVSADQNDIHIAKTGIARADHSFVFTARHPENSDQAVMFIAADRQDALPGLGRKLPHYHKYSYLAFEGSEPSNVAKGRWPVIDSPLTVYIPAADGMIKKIEMGRLAPREPLAISEPVFSMDRMMATIAFLAKDALNGREIGTPEIDKAADHIAMEFKQAGLIPGGDAGTYFQPWKDADRKMGMRNVIGVIPGKKPDWNKQSVVIGAHYDGQGLGLPGGSAKDSGKIHPGADDNASGVAVLTELARFFASGPRPDRTIVFIAFSGEEAGRLGSKFYTANGKHYPASECIGMVNLDTVGRLGKRKLLVLGSSSAKEWPHIFRGAGFVTGVEIDLVSEDLDSSDQKSFNEAGVPAVQLFSGPHLDYHRPGDTVEKIDPDGLVKVASVAK